MDQVHGWHCCIGWHAELRWCERTRTYRLRFWRTPEQLPLWEDDYDPVTEIVCRSGDDLFGAVLRAARDMTKIGPRPSGVPQPPS